MCGVPLLFPRLSTARMSGPLLRRRLRGSLLRSSGFVAPTRATALLLADSDDEALAPVPATAVQQHASSFGGHTRAEPVLVLPLAIVRPIGRHHVSIFRVRNGNKDSDSSQRARKMEVGPVGVQ